MKPILNFGWISLYSYPLVLGMAWGFGYHLFKYLLWKKNVRFENVFTFCTGIFISSWVGAKALFLLNISSFERAQYFYNESFWFGGGFVFYGGLFSAIIFCLVYCEVLKKFSLSNCYLLIPPLCFSHAIGRIGCFLSGCCYGKKSLFPWAVKLHGEFRHPVQVYESILLFFLGGLVLYFISRKKSFLFTLNIYFIGYSSVRFFLEFFRGDSIRGIHFLGLSTSQYFSSAILIFLILGLVLLNLHSTLKNQ